MEAARQNIAAIAIPDKTFFITSSLVGSDCTERAGASALRAKIDWSESRELLLQRADGRHHVLHLVSRHGLIRRHFRWFAICDDGAQVRVAHLLHVRGSQILGLHSFFAL